MNLPSKPEKCVVCNSGLTAYVRDVPTINLSKMLPLYYCLECESFTNPSGFTPSKTADETELKFHIKIEERNTKRSTALLEVIRQQFADVKNIVEIGCGTGIMIRVAKEMGLNAVGYDINEAAIEYGKKNFGADLRAELWDPKKQSEKVDLIFCIMVLEHIENPRPLFFQMAEAAKKHKAKLFISVPFLNRDRWKFILNPDPKVPNTPFFNNEVHVTHFSRKGMEMLAKEAGSTKTTAVSSMVSKDERGWGGFIFDFAPQPAAIVAKNDAKKKVTHFLRKFWNQIAAET